MLHSEDAALQPYPLGFSPTPLHRLTRLEQRYPGYRLWIKRDDLSGLGLGGNKVRKLAYHIGAALARGCDTVITAGAAQSNHCRQTAAACAQVGLDCHLLLGGDPPGEAQGNLLLSQLYGATLHFTGPDRVGAGLTAYQARLEATGRRCFVVPYGGSNALGARGFVDAVAEWEAQRHTQSAGADYLFFASSSGGTQAGMMLGLQASGSDTRLMPVSVDKESHGPGGLVGQVRAIGKALAPMLGLSWDIGEEAIPLLKGYDGAGYGQTSSAEWAALHLLARTEGILLDPVYTARAFAALLDHLEHRRLPAGAQVHFWHTGGQPALFASDPLRHPGGGL